MGTDIHGIFQAKDASGQWVDVPTEYREERHYQLFAVLADVRNGYGFAGVVTGDPVTPISDPRGLPDGFLIDSDYNHPVESLELMGRRAEWREDGEPLEVWMGDHSYSWLTGAEMLDWFEHAPTVTHTGYVDRSVYDAWDGRSCPESWCGGIEGPDVMTVEDEAMANRLPNWTHRRILWQAGLREELAYFFDEVARLAAEHGEIRFVFGFDS